jgi:hypothetical protein
VTTTHMTETAFDRICRLIETATGRTPRGSHAQRSAHCPAHDDTNPSLSITAAPDRVLVNCQAGCDTDSILEAIGASSADLFDAPLERDKPRDTYTVVATYQYTDPGGRVLYCKERRMPKDFRVWRPDGRGGKQWGIGDAPRVLYRLPQVLAAIQTGTPIYLVEGEKDVHAAENAGAVATCNFDGAAKAGHRPKWRPEYGDTLRGAHVIIVADNDPAGRDHARAALTDLHDKAATVRVVRGLNDAAHADLSDHLAAGHGLDDLAPLDLEEPEPAQSPLEDDGGWEDPADALIAELLDTDDLDNIPTLEPLVPGYLYRDTIARVYGKSGTFKSFLTLDFAGCVGTGKHWHGVPVRQGLVIYLVAEGSAGIRNRVRAWEQHHGHKMTGVKFLPRPVQAASAEWEVLIEVCRRLQPALVVADTQARVTVGIEENSATEMGRFIHRVEQLREASRACVLLVHHSGHNGEHGRGSTAVKGAMQTELTVTRNEGRGAAARVKLGVGKQKDIAEADDLELRLQVVQLAGEAHDDGRPVTSVVLVPAVPAGPEPGTVEDAVAKLDAMGAPVGWSRRKARTEASKQGIVLPRDEVLSKAINLRKDRVLSGSQSGSRAPENSMIGEPLSVVPEPGTTFDGTTGQSGSETTGTNRNQWPPGRWFPPTPPLGVGTSGTTAPRTSYCGSCGATLDPTFAGTGSVLCTVCLARGAKPSEDDP